MNVLSSAGNPGTLSNPRRVAVVAAIALVLVVLMLRQDTAVPAVSGAASPISGKCTGQQQGVIKGDSTIKGREGTYSITAASHGITSPRDSASGQATGRRQHKPVTITMQVSKATPPLVRALATNERLTSCVLNFWEPAANGKEKNYFRVRLTDAAVVDYSLTGRPGGADTVTFALTYQHIEWTYLEGGITAEDDWVSPVS